MKHPKDVIVSVVRFDAINKLVADSLKSDNMIVPNVYNAIYWNPEENILVMFDRDCNMLFPVITDLSNPVLKFQLPVVPEPAFGTVTISPAIHMQFPVKLLLENSIGERLDYFLADRINNIHSAENLKKLMKVISTPKKLYNVNA